MGAADDDTLQFYQRNAEAYAGWAKAPSTRLKAFLSQLPPGAGGDKKSSPFNDFGKVAACRS
jgi:hypothetical protein